jgi:hypothetical protein
MPSKTLTWLVDGCMHVSKPRSKLKRVRQICRPKKMKVPRRLKQVVCLLLVVLAVVMF